jgi:hypothetical protein
MDSILKLPHVSSRFSLGAWGYAKFPYHGMCAGYTGLLFSRPSFGFWVSFFIGSSSHSFILLQIVPRLSLPVQLVKNHSLYLFSYAINTGDVYVCILITCDGVGKYCNSLDLFCPSWGFSLFCAWGGICFFSFFSEEFGFLLPWSPLGMTLGKSFGGVKRSRRKTGHPSIILQAGLGTSNRLLPISP